MESKAIEAEQKRAMAEEGMLEHVFKPLSKKEEQARLDAKSKKGKQGVRTAKTGERCAPVGKSGLHMPPIC
jgi:hypothetical protein